MTQLHGINGSQPPQNAEFSPSVGKLGLHSVQIGTNPPVRLDTIKGNKIPFAGFRTATKVASAKTETRKNAALVLHSLSSPDGTLDVKALLNASKSMQTHLDRLGILGEIHGTMDDAVLTAFAPEVESLSNTELLYAYQQFLSPEMSLLRRALQHEISINPDNTAALTAAAHLFSLEALVTKEASNRIIIAQGLADPEEIPPLSAQYGTGIDGMGKARQHESSADISAVSMHILMDVAIDSSARRDQANGRAAGLTSRRNLGDIDARQFGDVLRSAGLTINVDLDFLLGLNGPKPLLKAGQTWEHLFHSIESAPDDQARQEAINVKGQGYIQKRDSVERSMFPELGEDRPVVANERPTYAALNLLRLRTGAAPSYGTVALHLKPEVARRATYTVDDTFIALRLRYTKEGRQAALDLLPGFPGISEEHKAEIMREGSELRQRFDALLESMAAKGEFRADLFKSTLKLSGLSDDENLALAGLFIKTFRDTQSSRKATATYDTLETLLSELNDVDAVNLARAALDRQQNGMGRVAVSNCNYIEAQVHGPLVFSRDVAEIVINREFGFEALPDEQKAWFNAVTAVLGGRQPSQADMASLSDEQRADLSVIREQLGSAVIPVRIEEMTPELSLKLDIETEEGRFYAAHFDQPGITEAFRTATESEAGLQAFIADALSMAPGGAAALRVLGDRPLVTGENMARIRDAFSTYVEQYRYAPVRGQHTESELLGDCVLRAVANVVGKGRLDCLTAIDSLTKDDTQRSALRDFVMARPPMNESAFKALASAALLGAATLDRLVPTEGEPLTDKALFEKLGNMAASFRRSLDAMPRADREATGEGSLLQTFGGLAFALVHKTSPETADRIAERLNTPDAQGLFSVLLRLGDTERGFPKDAGFRDALVFNAFQTGLRAALGGKAKPPTVFTGELSFVSQDDRNSLRLALPGLADSLDAAFPTRPTFPPAQGNLDISPAQHREFLLAMLPIYHDHEGPGSFDYGTAYHGRGHICRAFIFASAMAGIMEAMGHPVDRTALLCGIAGHDAGRTANGADTPEQEQESARLALEKMHTLFGADTFGEDYEREFTSAIVGHASRTLESMLLNAADSLDIGRVKDFDFKYFPFLRGGEQEGPHAFVPEYQILREQLHEEADFLARMTDPLTQIRDLRDKLIQADELETAAGIQRAASDAVAKQFGINDKEFLSVVEDKIRTHPDMFPLLTRFYLQPLARHMDGNDPAGA